MNQYLIKYLIDNADNALSKKYIDFFKIELDWHIYNGDKHISKVYHRDKEIETKKRLINLLHYSYSILSGANFKASKKKNVLSTVHFPHHNLVTDLGFNLYSPIWHPLGKKNVFGDAKTLRWHLQIQDLIRNKDFYLYLNPEFHTELESFQNYLVSQYQKQDFRALFLYTDQYFYSKYSIDVFKKMQKPSFIFSHGLPGLYSKDVDYRADYLLVWGEKIKQHYLDAGFENSKVKVVGHPRHKQMPKEQKLKSDLSDVLIIPVASSIYHQHRYDDTIIIDRSMVILYLYQVQSVLKKLGVKKARYRTHPTISKQWVHAFLDHDFYIQDNEQINASLNRSSLLIGSTSTLVLESLLHGVNYIVYEPVDEDGHYMTNDKLVPPFDGSEKKLMIANDEPELEKMLKANAMTDYSLVHDYIQDLDLTILKELIS